MRLSPYPEGPRSFRGMAYMRMCVLPIVYDPIDPYADQVVYASDYRWRGTFDGRGKWSDYDGPKYLLSNPRYGLWSCWVDREGVPQSGRPPDEDAIGSFEDKRDLARFLAYWRRHLERDDIKAALSVRLLTSTSV